MQQGGAQRAGRHGVMEEHPSPTGSAREWLHSCSLADQKGAEGPAPQHPRVTLLQAGYGAGAAGAGTWEKKTKHAHSGTEARGLAAVGSTSTSVRKFKVEVTSGQNQMLQACAGRAPGL